MRRTGLQGLHQMLTASSIRKRAAVVFRGAVATLHSLCKGSSPAAMKCALPCRDTAALQHLRAAAWWSWRHQNGGRKTHCTEWEPQGEQDLHPSLPCCQSNRCHAIPLIPVTCLFLQTGCMPNPYRVDLQTFCQGSITVKHTSTA